MLTEAHAPLLYGTPIYLLSHPAPVASKIHRATCPHTPETYCTGSIVSHCCLCSQCAQHFNPSCCFSASSLQICHHGCCCNPQISLLGINKGVSYLISLRIVIPVLLKKKSTSVILVFHFHKTGDLMSSRCK